MPLFAWGKNKAPAPAPAPKPRFVRRADEALPDSFARWLHGGAPPPRQAGSLRRVEEAERRYGLRLPEDFRRYLVEAAPAEDTMDDELTNWAGLHRIRTLPEEYGHPIRHPAIAAEAGAYLFFADYMLWCWGWAICCSEGPNRGRVAIIGEPDGFVAGSFDEFLDRYLSDPVEMACARGAA